MLQAIKKLLSWIADMFSGSDNVSFGRFAAGVFIGFTIKWINDLIGRMVDVDKYGNLGNVAIFASTCIGVAIGLYGISKGISAWKETRDAIANNKPPTP